MPLVPMEAFPFAGPSYLQSSPVLGAQRSINLYPEPMLDRAKGPMALIGRPGLYQFSSAINSPCRGLWPGHQRLFAVGGTHVYEVSNAGTVTTDYGAMAGSSGVGPCYFAQNGGATGAFQLLVLDPSASSLYNLTGGAAVKVFDATALEYLDGYNLAIATGASLAYANNPNQINASNFGDGATWGALNYAITTGSSSLPIQLAVLNNLLWIFKEQDIEVFYNAGLSGFPFARMNGGMINVGLMAKHSVVKLPNTLLWLGSTAAGYAKVYLARGLSPVPVSTPAIEQFINSYSTLGLQNATAYGYEENGHTFYCLNLNDSSGNPQVQVVYDLSTGLWHERTYGAVIGAGWPVCAASVPGFLSPNGILVGDGYYGLIWGQDSFTPFDAFAGGTEAITYTRVCPHFADRLQVLRYARFEIDGDLGSAPATLTYSNDGGRTWPVSPSYSMQQADDVGFTGVTYKRQFATQLGRSRDRVFRVDISSDSQLVRIANAYLTIGD